MMITDDHIAARTGNSTESWEQLNAVVNRYCLSLTRSSWDAEDLAQETWLKAIGTLNGPGHVNPEALLLRIAKTTWIDQSRRRASWTRIVERHEQQLLKEKAGFTWPDQGLFEMEMAFHSLMRHLSPLQRTVFLLRELLGFSIEETARKLRTTEGAVKSALHRARQSLAAVKAELEAGDVPLPEEEQLRAFLRAIATAYAEGNIAALLELSQQGEIAPAVAVGIAQHRLLHQARSGPVRGARSAAQPQARLAA